ncbi:MAG TPA: hypothetical protein VL919_09290 [Vicinamibacterales bacterium]|nr:hypothetical protein [Vicinamibacterales bacterium]
MLSLATANAAAAQTPQPFPRPNSQKPAQPPPTTTAKPPAPAPQSPAPQAPSAPQAPKAPQETGEPTEAMLGAPIYPSAVYLTSYDAGRGQRFYLFGSTVPYAELVAYYKTVLKQKGDELFEAPPTHQFETARFRDESMAFAPSVTIKDYTYGGSAGYPNPKKGGDPARFPSVIQIVPAPR